MNLLQLLGVVEIQEGDDAKDQSGPVDLFQCCRVVDQDVLYTPDCALRKAEHGLELRDYDEECAGRDEAAQGRPREEAHEEGELEDAHERDHGPHQQREDGPGVRPLLQVAVGCQLVPREQADEAARAHRGVHAGAQEGVDHGGQDAAVGAVDQVHLAEVRVRQGLRHEDAPQGRRAGQVLRAALLPRVGGEPVHDGEVPLRDVAYAGEAANLADSEPGLTVFFQQREVSIMGRRHEGHLPGRGVRPTPCGGGGLRAGMA
mmetsp:Transcript_18736/g.52947  ORF Transcript_18736/g.52947 Transcript_18736/m.52947 type:complete len:260 (+) Transcript_18736:1448-2227(+)